MSPFGTKRTYQSGPMMSVHLGRTAADVSGSSGPLMTKLTLDHTRLALFAHC
jgi:hypothetical protein